MKQEFYPESSIREQIEAGGADDWQIRLGGYVVSLYYTQSPKSGIARIVPFRRSDRLSVIVYRQLPDGTKEAVWQIRVPARNANLWTDHRDSLRIVAHDGRLCIFSVTASGGPEFLGGKWGRIASDDPIPDEERQRGITRATERWVSMKNK